MSKQDDLLVGHGRVDRFGIFASSACALHCAVCALVPAAFAVLGLDFLLGQSAEWILTLVAVGFGCLAFYLGWQRHRQTLVFILLGVGIVGLLAVRLMAGHGDHHDHGAHAQTAAHHGEERGEAHGDEEHHEEAAQAGHGKHQDSSQVADAKTHEDEHDEHGDRDGHGEHDEHGEHHDHGPGEGLGVLAGLILMVGHLSNLQAMRRHGHEDACDSEPS